jgi:hypothetical protein
MNELLPRFSFYSLLRAILNYPGDTTDTRAEPGRDFRVYSEAVADPGFL